MCIDLLLRDATRGWLQLLQVYRNIQRPVVNPLPPNCFVDDCTSSCHMDSFSCSVVRSQSAMGIFPFTIWLFNLAMERSTIFKFGKPSISIRAIYTKAMLVITRGYFMRNHGQLELRLPIVQLPALALWRVRQKNNWCKFQIPPSKKLFGYVYPYHPSIL